MKSAKSKKISIKGSTHSFDFVKVYIFITIFCLNSALLIMFCLDAKTILKHFFCKRHVDTYEYKTIDQYLFGHSSFGNVLMLPAKQV